MALRTFEWSSERIGDVPKEWGHIFMRRETSNGEIGVVL